MSSLDLLEDACEKLPHATRKMFGGAGLFATNGGMFAGIVDEDRIILKFARGEPAGDEFRAAGAVPWVYKGKQGTMTMAEWLLVPDEMYDEPRMLAEWAARAHKIAPAKKTSTKTAGPRTTQKAPPPKTPAARKPAGKKPAAKRLAAKKPTSKKTARKK